MKKIVRAKYRRYLALKDAGLRKEANELAQAVVAEYQKDPDKSLVVEICAATDHKINHHIWKGLVLPMYLAESDSPAAIRCMIQTIQNLYSCKPEWERLDWLSEDQLIDKLLAIVPNDEWAIARKMDALSRWLAFVVHEWPSGVLYGMDGATLEQCGEILDAVEQLRALDTESRFESLCKDVAEKTVQYRDRLRSADSEVN